MNLYDIALQYRQAGLSCLPTKNDPKKEKAPNLYEWTPYKTRLPNEEELRKMFALPDNLHIGFVCGTPSQNLEVIDYDIKNDQEKQFETFFDHFMSFAYGEQDILKKLVIEDTPSGGKHIYYRYQAEPKKNTALAYNEQGQKIWEIKTQGGFVVCAPSKGYALWQNHSFEELQTITDKEREMLHDFIKTFCKKPKYTHTPQAIIEPPAYLATDSEIFEFCLGIVEKSQTFIDGNRNNFITHLAGYCNKKGCDMYTAQGLACQRFASASFSEKEIKTTFESLYKNHTDQHNTEPYTPTKPKKENKPKKKEKEKTGEEGGEKSEKQINRIENYLQENYSFMYDNVKDCILWKKKRTHDLHASITARDINNFLRELEKKGFAKVSKERLLTILESDFSKETNPIKEYFRALPKMEGGETTEFQKLCDSITTTNQKYFEKCLLKWCVASVANVMFDDKCQNHTCLVLTGGQGKQKSTWLDNLCPPALRAEYLYTGRLVLKVDNDNTLRIMASHFIVNIDDQLNELNNEDENALKNLITLPKCKYRRLHSNIFENKSHIGNFAASVNGFDFLTDSTGSRRFLAFCVKDLDREKMLAVDMNKVWAEASALYKANFQYWFDATEVEELEKNNMEFSMQTTEQDLLMNLYSPTPTYDMQAPEFVQTGILLNRLQQYAKITLSIKKLGKVLTKHFERTTERVGNIPTKGFLVYPYINQTPPQ